MRNIIITDMHGKDPCEIVRKEQKESGIERAVFLGDYDTPDVFGKIRNLEIPKIFIVGNHDWHYFHNLEIYSPLMNNAWQNYVKLWENSPEQKAFIEDIIQGRIINAGLIVESKAIDKKIVYCHGSIVEGENWETGAPQCLYQRMKDFRAPEDNFKEMIRKNYWVMFRGHDHKPQILTYLKNCRSQKICVPEDLQNLEQNKTYIITVGAFCEGQYVLFDDKTGLLELRRCMSQRHMSWV